MDFSTLRDFLLVFLGFGLIIFVHELGHFLAARWAGIRVLAFALGFGPAIASYRKGMGWRRGSSEAEYLEAIRGGPDASGPKASSTEYRLNWLPFGGYVKMLGQEDFNPGAVSQESDSYQNCPPWKRMVVISAGVVMNIITAALLFMVVFKVGLQTEAPVIGAVLPGSPAALANATPAPGATLDTNLAPGLKPGDRVLTINGRAARQFNDLTMATAMARRGASVHLLVERDVAPGATQRLGFEIIPKAGSLTKLLEIGVEPGRTTQLFDVPAPDREQFTKDIAKLGLPGLEPKMRLVRAGSDASPKGPQSIDTAFKGSGGEPVELEFVGEGNQRLIASVRGVPDMESIRIPVNDADSIAHAHLLGLAPVLMVEEPQERAIDQGLADGDIFARLGSVEYPSLAVGIAEVRAHAGRTIDIVVLRNTGPNSLERADAVPPRKEVALKVKVAADGTIGFRPSDTSDADTLLALPLAGHALPAASAISKPGTRLVSIDGQAVTNFRDIRRALDQASKKDGTIALVINEPAGPGQTREREVAWELGAPAIARLASLGWHSPLPYGVFELEQTTLRASSPVDALKMGFAETKRVMVMTYVTFARLFEGTVKVEHLKGPVGIAHLGTKVAGRGWIWLLFFLALVSVNLAVINFLPLPIVDGGQFIFLVIEQIRGRPVSIAVQNVATLAGLVLIVGVFLLVTFNDIVNLLG